MNTLFHLAAFGGAKTDSTANENAPAVIDNALTTSANARYIAPETVRVFYAQAQNDTITRARITAPSLRNEGLPEIDPVMVSDIPSTNPVGAVWDENGPTIRNGEEFGIESSNGASTIDKIHCLLAFRSIFAPVPAGKRMTIVGTSANTLVVDSWTLAGITLDQVLPNGRYAVIGMRVKCTAAYGARLVFPRGGSYRPGCPVYAAVSSFVVDRPFERGRQGEWGRFDSIAQPLLELIGTTAGAQTAQVVLDLVQISVAN